MSSIYTTSGSPNNTQVGVRSAPNQTVEAFVGAWIAEVWSCYTSDPATLVVTGSSVIGTTWLSAAGLKSKTTTRNTGETDDELLTRHVEETLSEMTTFPPVP